MNKRTSLFLAAAMVFAAPVMAGNNLASVDDLVAESGLTKQQVRMLIGARTPYPAYRAGYERLRKQLIASVGRERFDELVIELRKQSDSVETHAG